MFVIKASNGNRQWHVVCVQPRPNCNVTKYRLDILMSPFETPATNASVNFWNVESKRRPLQSANRSEYPPVIPSRCHWLQRKRKLKQRFAFNAQRGRDATSVKRGCLLSVAAVYSSNHRYCRRCTDTERIPNNRLLPQPAPEIGLHNKCIPKTDTTVVFPVHLYFANHWSHTSGLACWFYLICDMCWKK